MEEKNELNFWIVWNPDSPRTPRYRHFSEEDADSEAFRLAIENPGQTFYVLAAVGGRLLAAPMPQQITFAQPPR